MYKVLLWKEYRETRLSLALTIMGCSVLSRILYSTADSGNHSIILNRVYYLGEPFFVIIVLLIMFYASMTGAEAFAPEYQAKTFDYLVSRAVSRKMLWISKFFLRISTLLPTFALFLFINKYTLLSQRTSFEWQCLIIFSSLLLFSTSMFFSAIFNRPVKAGISGVIVFLFYTGLFAYFSENSTGVALGGIALFPTAFGIGCVMLSILILAASCLIFTKGKISSPF